MRFLFSISLLVLFDIWATAQVTVPAVQASEPITLPSLSADSLLKDPNTIHRMMDKEPVYPGGQEAFMKELASHIAYPDEAEEEGISGRVFLRYVVEKDGRITDARVVRGLYAPCDSAAVKALRSMPPYAEPAQLNGVPIRVYMHLPVMFHHQ